MFWSLHVLWESSTSSSSLSHGLIRCSLKTSRKPECSVEKEQRDFGIQSFVWIKLPIR